MSNDLTYYERQMLEYWLKTKMSIREIARLMKRNHTIIGREIKKNVFDRKRYRADLAQASYEKRKHVRHRSKLDKYPELRQYVEARLKDDWSPEQIAGRLKTEGRKVTISHESIYYHIYERSEKSERLYAHLRTNRVKRKLQGKRKSQKISITERKSIHTRPVVVCEYGRFGDWESDTMEFRRSKQNPYLSVQFERKSKLVRIRKISKKTAEETNYAIINTIESVPKGLVKTITFDNGTEGAKHYEIRNDYGIDTYFCDPFCSWQKGGVENSNKLIRQYLPRDTELNNLTDYDIYLIQERLNNRPRKLLNYQTPNEVIHKVVL